MGSPGAGRMTIGRKADGHWSPAIGGRPTVGKVTVVKADDRRKADGREE